MAQLNLDPLGIPIHRFAMRGHDPRTIQVTQTRTYVRMRNTNNCKAWPIFSRGDVTPMNFIDCVLESKLNSTPSAPHFAWVGESIWDFFGWVGGESRAPLLTFRHSTDGQKLWASIQLFLYPRSVFWNTKQFLCVAIIRSVRPFCSVLEFWQRTSSLKISNWQECSRIPLVESEKWDHVKSRGICLPIASDLQFIADQFLSY